LEFRTEIVYVACVEHVSTLCNDHLSNFNTNKIILCFVLTSTFIICIFLVPPPHISLTVSTISRGGVKINVSCYRYVIKLIFDLDGPRFKKLVPARLPSPCLEKYIKKTTLQIEKMRTIENVMCARYSGMDGISTGEGGWSSRRL